MIIFKRKEVEKHEFKIPYRVSVPNLERCNSFRREEKEGNERVLVPGDSLILVQRSGRRNKC